MLTYRPQSNTATAPVNDKPFLLLLLCLVWVVTGLVGHEPWRPDELYQIAIVRYFADHGLGLVPMLGGEPFLQTPPLYYWVATLFTKALSPWLFAFADAARLATGLFLAISLFGIGFSTRLLYGQRTGRLAVLILLGCVGFVGWGHQLSTEIAALAGFSILIYGCARASRAMSGARWLLVGLLTVFLSGTLLEVLLAVMLPLLLIASPHWRSNGFPRTVAWVLPVVMLLSALWPLGIYLHQPWMLHLWFSHDGLVRLHPAALSWDQLGYYVRQLPWFAWPALPLAAWTTWKKRGQYGAGEHLTLIASISWLIAISCCDPKRNILALPLLLPLAILAAGGVDSLRRNTAAALNWFGLFTFGALALYVWLAWCGVLFGWPHDLAQHLQAMNPDFHLTLRPAAIMFAITFNLLWLWAIVRRRSMARQAIANWTLGLTMFWGVAVALALPWLDANHSYRGLAEHIASHVQPDYRCIEGRNLHPWDRGALFYYARLDSVARFSRKDCRYLLLRDDDKANLSPAPALPLLWQGNPPVERSEWFRLYRLR